MAYDDKARKAQEQGFFCYGYYADKETAKHKAADVRKGVKAKVIKHKTADGLKFFELWLKM